MLPLESISSDSTTLELVLPLSLQSTDLQSLGRDVKRASRIDDYTASGKISAGLQQGRNTNIVRSWEKQLRSLLKDRYGEDPIPGKGKTRIELEPILQTHVANQLDSKNEPR